MVGVIGLLFGSVIACWRGDGDSAALKLRLSLMEKELLVEKAGLARLLRVHEELIADRARLESMLNGNERPATKRWSYGLRGVQFFRSGRLCLERSFQAPGPCRLG